MKLIGWQVGDLTVKMKRSVAAHSELQYAVINLTSQSTHTIGNQIFKKTLETYALPRLSTSYNLLRDTEDSFAWGCPTSQKCKRSSQFPKARKRFSWVFNEKRKISKLRNPTAGIKVGWSIIKHYMNQREGSVANAVFYLLWLCLHFTFQNSTLVRNRDVEFETHWQEGSSLTHLWNWNVSLKICGHLNYFSHHQPQVAG